MLLPLWDSAWNREVPWVTYGLIAANLVAFFWSFLGIGFPTYVEETIPGYGLVLEGLRPWMFLTHLFLHGGWGHVAGNMFFLGFFGRNVERRLGSLAFLAAYLSVGCSAGLFQLGSVGLSGRGTDVPMVGSSGAVFGIVGLHAALFGRREVRLLVPRIRVVGWKGLPIAWTDTYLAAHWLGLVYLVWNVLDGLFLERLTGVAHWAHVGGFVGGGLLGLLSRAAGWTGRAEVRRTVRRRRIEEDAFEELGYIPEPDPEDPPPLAGPRVRPIHRRAGPRRVVRVPSRDREARESIQTRLMLPGLADHAVLLCHEERLADRELAELQAVADGRYGSRHGRWGRMGVLNRTLTRIGADLVRSRVRDLGHVAVGVPSLRLLPLPDARTVTRLGLGAGHLDVADHRGQIRVLPADDLLFLSAGRTARSTDAPYFLDLFSDSPLARWRINRANFAFAASGVRRGRCDHERFQALVGRILDEFPFLPIATAALDLLLGRHPDGYSFDGLGEFEHYNDWVLQILGLERVSPSASLPETP